MSQATTSSHLNNNNPTSSTEIADPLSGPTSRRRDGYQPPEGTPLEDLFKPGMQSLTNYNLALAHQRANASFDTYLGENNVDAGVELFTKVRHEGPIEAISLAFCFTIRAALTLDLDDIHVARKHVQFAERMCKKLMKNSLFNNISKLVVTPNYDKYSDVEVMAQLYYAKTYCLNIVLYAMETNSVFTLIKLCYHLRGLVRTYNECFRIKKNRKAWQSEDARKYFVAHLKLGNGLMNVIISHTPPKFLRIMNFLGYKGTESFGLNEINRVAFESDAGFSSKKAQLVLIYYWVYFKPHGENIPEDLSVCKQLIEAELQLFPKSMLYGLAKAKTEQIAGRFDNAIQVLNSLLSAPNLEIAHKSFYFELIWCHSIKCDWVKCMECSTRIRDSKHSPVLMAYLYAIFRYVQGYDTSDQRLIDEATEVFKLIPTLRIRHFGKTMTTEKAAIRQAELYLSKGNRLVLPIIAILYTGNYLMFIRDERELDRLMERVEREIEKYKCDYENQEECLDDYLTAMFYRGVFLRLKKQYTQAMEIFDFILTEKSRIDLETSIVPMTTLEKGLIELELGNHDQAKQWLDHAEKDFSGYNAENFVHIRVYAAIRRMGCKTDKQEEDKEKLNKYIKQWLKYHEIDLNTYRKLIMSEN